MPGALHSPGCRAGAARLLSLVLCLSCLAAAPSVFPAETYAGRTVPEVLQQLRAAGAPLIYSSNLVTPDLVVLAEPRSGEALEIARQVLAPHGLELQSEGGVYVVVRREAARAESTPHSAEGAERLGPTGPPRLEIVTVSASRYLLQGASAFYVDQRAIQVLPDLGEDPLRSAHRLPGAAASGLSSKTHFRGGEHDETAIYLNGLELLDPFHIRDYHGIFSSIDARAISGVEAYTGGFPARFGDHMSGVLSLESQRPEMPRHTELGLSVYNTSLLHSGYSSDERWDWLFSARDSNLDVVLNPDLGSPDYFDVFAQLGHRASDRVYIALNALYANDSVTVITENNPEELERSDSDTENRHFWITLENDWRPQLSSATILSGRSLKNLRLAQANDPERMIARVVDSREANDWGIRQDWQWTGWARHDLRWGFEYRDYRARYRYDGVATYIGFLAELPELENSRKHLVDANPGGHGLSLFVSDLFNWRESTWLELGLRWDRQTWTAPKFDDQFSPRISLLHQLAEGADVRLSWGRYSQSQAIHELQVEDGVNRFFSPQRSDHLIAGYRKYFSAGYRLRAELFLKRYDRLKPRFENLFDPLALIPELSPDRVRLDPVDAEARGLELSLEHRDDGPIEWWLTYVLSRATDRIDGRDQPRSWDQRHALQAGFSWRRDPWELGAAISAHTGWPTTPLMAIFDPDEDEFIPLVGERNSETLGRFFALDFRISREFHVRKGRLSAFLEVSNATNRHNECCVDYDVDDDVDPPALDRSIDNWVPIIPAVGVLWEF